MCQLSAACSISKLLVVATIVLIKSSWYHSQSERPFEMGRCRVTIHFRNPCIAKKGGVSTVARFFWWISVQRPTLSDNNPIKVIDPPPPPQIYNILQKVIIHPQFVKISPEILYFIMSIYAFFVPISISVCQNWRVDRAGGKPILAMPRFRKILVTLPFPYGVSESVTNAGTQ